MRTIIQEVITVLFVIAAFTGKTNGSGKIGHQLFNKRLHGGLLPSLPANLNLDNVSDKWITQSLDQLNKSDSRMWKMRYISNDQYFVDGGPMFILLGGRSEITSRLLNGGHLHDIAAESNGYLFHLEHRYYGKSRPTPDLSMDNLKYLSVRQALADVAHFIHTKKNETTALANSKVILAGGGYAGSMVVWFKRLYPHLIDGGWASSAPLLAKMEFFEFEEVGGKAIRSLGSQQCYDRIQNGITVLENMFRTNRSDEAIYLLEICNKFNANNTLELWSLFGSISELFSSSLIKDDKEVNVPQFCTSLMDHNTNDTTAVVNFIANSLDYPTCLEMYYQDTIDFLSNTINFAGQRQWFYQACNEFGWFVTSGSRNQPFGNSFPLAFYTAVCSDIFGKQYTSSFIEERILFTNEQFGGVNPRVTGVYMTYGEFDQWAALGHQPNDWVTNIRGAFASRDLESIETTDSPEMAAAKRRIAESIHRLINL